LYYFVELMRLEWAVARIFVAAGLWVAGIVGGAPFLGDVWAQEVLAGAASGDAGLAREGKAGAAGRLVFREVAAEMGVTTVPNSRTDRRYVLETMGAGGSRCWIAITTGNWISRW
jgi:hypothetical protein